MERKYIDHPSISLQQFVGCSESTRFTIKEQREAAEPLLLWQAESAGGEKPAVLLLLWRAESARREHKIHNQRAARGCGAITITASRERRRRAACGCFYYYGERRARGESTRFTIKEQREAAEPNVILNESLVGSTTLTYGHACTTGLHNSEGKTS